ncbi:beta strand repeat-containing protein [Flavobacterium degerlachei]|uniref:Uncharacterized protein n=1 Tax=Flavobacterium degerlachei TaxID=229203 RepID=A0A1H3BID7_9FLAO|nr:hypothetical protein [Flavobacterium degerlachei]SDX41723.1 hypothetical protein SAMN05444338_11028 [Flavobacterium degerlachei]
MKKIIILLLFFTVAKNFAQTNGITYQAVIMNARGNQLPSVAVPNIPLVEKDVCMIFKFIDEFSNIEYQESIQTKTDQFGMVNLIIGTGTQTAGYAESFKSIVWSSLSKNLVVGINTDGNCSSYTEISNQPFSYVPLAFSALNAENVTGVVAIENGGTNAITVLGAKTNFEIQNVDNTRDIDKPISALTQSGLNRKEDLVNKSINLTIDSESDTKYPTVKAVKTYVDASLNLGSTAVVAEVERATAAENAITANLVAESNARSTADGVLTTNLNSEVTNRTAAVALKEDLANKSTDVSTDGTSDTKYPTVKSVKNYVDASSTSSSSALTAEISRAKTAEIANADAIATETTNRTSADATLTSNLALESLTARAAESANATAIATETTNRISAVALKEDLANKSTDVSTDGTSDTKYPTVKSVKNYVDASSTSSSSALTAEISRAKTAEIANADAIATETTNRISADVTLTSNLALEVSTARAAESANATAIATEATNRTTAVALKEDLANKSTNVSIDGTSDTKYPTVKSVKSYVDASSTSSSSALSTEISRATAAETANATAIATETTNRTAADATLASNLALEASTARAAESANATAIATENTNRTTADATLASNLTLEASTARAAESANATAIATETSNRTTADATLASNLALESSMARAAESANATAIATETSNRSTADLLKEDLANKSTDILTDGASDTKYPSVKSVKTYVDASSTSSSSALAAEISRAKTAEIANADAIATENTNRTAADATLASNLTLEGSTARAAESANVAAIATETTNRTTADALKEDLANKSTDVSTDGASDTKYPTVKSVKSYVDASSTSSSSALTAEISRATGAEATNASTIATETTNRTIADATLESNLALEASTARAAESANVAAIATETTNRTTADALKEDLVNKSTDVSTDGTSDTKYPTVKSVKSYVDASSTSSSSALTAEISRATGAEATNASTIATETANRTIADATLESNLALEASTARAAESANATAIATETTNRATAEAILASNLTIEASTARAAESANATAIVAETTNRTAADLLKEDLANKSTDVSTDGASDTKYPTVKSVKSYVDASSTSSSSALTAEISRAKTAEIANADTIATETTNRTTADLLKEDLANKSNDVTTDGASDTKYPTVKSVKTYVDASSTSGSTALTAEISRAKTAEIANADAIATETTNRTTADATLASNLASEALTARAAESANATAIATETTNRNTADLLKENLTNKSTDVSTDGTSDTKYPTVKSVKNYVDASSTSSSSALTAEISRAKTSEIANADTIATETTNRTTADLLKENLANKSNDVTTDGASDTKYPTVKSVKTYVDVSSTSSSTALTAEISRAKTAEIANADAIANETTDRTTADATLASNLTLEASTARAAESANATAIATETTNRATAEAILASNLTIEASTARAAESANATTIAAETTNRTAADLLKEDLVNKSTDVTTDGTSDTKYPTVKSVKTYVDASSTSGSTALSTEISRATSAEATNASAISTETTNRTAADATLTSNLASEALTARTSEAANATAITTEITNRTNVDLLKEDLVNKSTDVTTDGASDTKYPTVKSVKTYVDASSATSSTALTAEISRAKTAEIANADAIVTETTNRISADASLASNLTLEASTARAAESANATAIATETTNRTTADATLVSNLALEASTARAAESANATAIATETTNRSTADALKEDLANKSTDVSTDGASDSKYPTVKSVKSYVDASSTSNSSALTAEILRAKTAESTNADAIATETTNRTTADATLASNLALEASTARAAESANTTAIATETSNRSTADLLKEDLANKSTDVSTDGTSDTKYPTVKSVKSYVDASSTSSSSALTAEISRAKTAEIANADTIATETINRISADGTLTTSLATEASTARAAESANATAIATESTNRISADVLKEDLANKSTDVSADGTSDTKYPTVKSVKNYVDASSTSSSSALTAEISRAKTSEIANADAIATETTNRTTADGILTTNLALKANLASPTFTGTVSGISATMVGLGDVDNTSDENKPVSTATQTAIDLKANLDSPTLTGTPLAPTATAETNSTQIATTEYVTTAIATSGSNFLPITGGTLSGSLSGTTGDFSSNFSVSSLTLAGASIWEFGISGTSMNLMQGGCCRRLTIDEEGRFGIGANYDPLYQLDVQGDGRFTSAVTATSFKVLDGTASQFLKADGTVDATNYLTSTDATNFVDLTSNQLVAGAKSFSSNVWVNGISFGKNGSQSLFIGESVNDGSAENATAIGFMTLDGNSGSGNTAIGTNSMRNSGATSNNTAVGENAGSGSNTGGYNTLIGKNANVDYNTPSITNASAIGAGAVVLASNTIQLGNTAITDVIASGVYTGSSFKTPTGTSSEFLKADGSVDSNTYLTQSSAGTNFVNLTANQTIDGTKTFSSDVNINGLTIGRGNFNENSNTAIGLGALGNNAGYANTAIGRGALAANDTNGGNTALGYIALANNISGADNVAVGTQSLETNISGSENTAIGKNADVASDGISNSVAIGANAIVTASNTIQLGSDGTGSHTAITNVKTSGAITAASYIKSGGTAIQYLMADGSVSTGAAPVREVADEFSAAANQTDFTLTQTPSVNSKVKLYLNGIRISNTAYNWTGKALIYVPANNGGYDLSADDRIQFDYFY